MDQQPIVNVVVYKITENGEVVLHQGKQMNIVLNQDQVSVGGGI